MKRMQQWLLAEQERAFREFRDTSRQLALDGVSGSVVLAVPIDSIALWESRVSALATLAPSYLLVGVVATRDLVLHGGRWYAAPPYAHVRGQSHEVFLLPGARLLQRAKPKLFISL